MTVVYAALVLCSLGFAALPALAQPTVASPPATAARPPNSAAMYEFLLARQAEARDDAAAAEAALQRAVALDPSSAELRAEQAGFFARQNRAADAVAAAERAVGLDAESEEGHRILGLVYAAWADGAVDGPAGGTTEGWRSTAIDHLTRIQSSPAMATDVGLQLTLARQLLTAKQAEKALPLLERIVGQTGPAVEPLALLAETHRSLGQFDRAATVLEQAAASNPRYYLALGDLYERQDKWEEAAAAYEKGAANVRGTGRELRLRRAAALLNIPDGAGAERAVTLLTEFVAANPKDVAGHTLLARAYLQRDVLADAERAAKAALALEPANLQVLGLLAGVYRDRYDFAAIVTLLAPMRDGAAPSGVRLGEFVRLLAELGGAQQQVGDAAAAVRTFERARALLPDAVPVTIALAQAHLQAGQFEQAQRIARDARATSKADLGLLRIEALAGVKAGRAADAVGFLERAIGDRRTEPEAAFVLADVYEEARRFDDAIKTVSALGGAAPADDAVAFRLAAAYEAADRVPDAERVFRAIVSRDPLHANALNFLGYMLADRGIRVGEALTLIDRALAVEPGNPAYLDSRGWALFKLGRAADAEEPLRRAATALRGSSVIQSHYADVLAALGKRQEAAAALDLAIAGDGTDVDRAALERRLRQLRPRAR